MTPAVEREGTNLCTMALGTQTFGIATDRVYEALAECLVRPVPLAPRFVAGILAFRGEALLAVSLRAVLGLGECVGPSSGVVLRDSESDELYAVLVDRVLDVERAERSEWEANPLTLGSRQAAIFAGVYRRSGAPLIQLLPDRLQPSSLAGRWTASDEAEKRETA